MQTKKPTALENAEKKAQTFFMYGLLFELFFLVIPSLFRVVNPSRVGGKGGMIEKTFLEPFFCTKWAGGIGDGSYEKYCNIFEYLFGFPQIIITIMLIGILIILSLLVYLYFLFFIKPQN
jgi:hypothetical protein